jgi:hypothetical protein
MPETNASQAVSVKSRTAAQLIPKILPTHPCLGGLRTIGEAEPVEAENYRAGALDFKVKDHGGTVRVRPLSVRKPTSIALMRKETCSDSGR